MSCSSTRDHNTCCCSLEKSFLFSLADFCFFSYSWQREWEKNFATISPASILQRTVKIYVCTSCSVAFQTLKFTFAIIYCKNKDIIISLSLHMIVSKNIKIVSNLTAWVKGHDEVWDKNNEPCNINFWLNIRQIIHLLNMHLYTSNDISIITNFRYSQLMIARAKT